MGMIGQIKKALSFHNIKSFFVSSITNVGTLEGAVLHKIQLSIKNPSYLTRSFLLFPLKRCIFRHFIEYFTNGNSRITFIYVCFLS